MLAKPWRLQRELSQTLGRIRPQVKVALISLPSARHAEVASTLTLYPSPVILKIPLPGDKHSEKERRAHCSHFVPMSSQVAAYFSARRSPGQHPRVLLSVSTPHLDKNKMIQHSGCPVPG